MLAAAAAGDGCTAKAAAGDELLSTAEAFGVAPALIFSVGAADDGGCDGGGSKRWEGAAIGLPAGDAPPPLPSPVLLLPLLLLLLLLLLFDVSHPPVVMGLDTWGSSPACVKGLCTLALDHSPLLLPLFVMLLLRLLLLLLLRLLVLVLVLVSLGPSVMFGRGNIAG
jgi:hypothetical protein